MFANIVLCCALAFWIGAGLLWLGRHTCRTFKGGLLRRSGPGTRIAMLVMALYSLYVGGSKRGSVTISDDYIADAGSYLTNDVAHVAISKKTPILPDDTEILVYARELSKSNATDWVRLSPYLTFADHPYDYTLVNATNYNVMVAASYTPAPTVHTNGVWVLKGFEIPGWNSHYSFGNSKIKTITPWENPYITYGLVAMWDGEWNAGGGVHDANATVWKDCVYGREFILNDCTVSDNAIVLKGTTTSYAVLSQEDSAATFNLIPTDGTMELVFYVPSDLSAHTLLKSNVDIGFNWNSARTVGVRNSLTRTGAADFAAYLHYYAIVYYGTSNNFYLYKDGTIVNGRASNSDIGGYAPNGTTVLGARSGSSTAFNMQRNTPATMYSIRVYNRQLTAEEIAHNYEVDKARFNLP